ncbi:DNA invertase Pin-like site-specific DNA recombinase [Paraburkholderia terricola]|uniref:recombinase family protein n=1 Tax=Paraburkholderia terricola TaxID=169427 RepID=UPI00285BFCC2|nr:recombinase family protein [Paraburkholderia terricola]MDR6495279.1 DNA invertase Pin-like site-specific DNA recombinase [Paraburkholderia terricola]
MDIGYVRVSTRDQNLALQVDALRAAGYSKVLTEIADGASVERPVLADLLDDVRPDDVIVIWKLDRLGRSLRHLIDVVGALLARDVGLRSLNDLVGTTTAQGRLVFNLFAWLAEFERDVIRERTQTGLSSTRARGRKGGRPKGLPEKAEPTRLPFSFSGSTKARAHWHAQAAGRPARWRVRAPGPSRSSASSQ